MKGGTKATEKPGTMEGPDTIGKVPEDILGRLPEIDREGVLKALMLCKYDPDPGQTDKFFESCVHCPYHDSNVPRCVELYLDAAALILGSGQKREWVYCKDRMPPSGGCHVFAAVRSLVDDREPWLVEVYFARFWDHDHWGWADTAIPMIENGEAEVYAWMPRLLPEVPELPDAKGAEPE